MTSPVDTLKALVVEMRETERELRVEDRSVGIWPDNDTADIVKEWRERTDAAIAALSGGEAVASKGLRDELQTKCSAWGTYWRAPDAHGVILPIEQATELLRDALAVEVEITAPRIPDGCVAVEAGFLRHVASVCRGTVDLCEPKPQRTPEDDREYNGGLCLNELGNIAERATELLTAAPGDEGRGEQSKYSVAFNVTVKDGNWTGTFEEWRARYNPRRAAPPAAPREE